MSASLSAGPTEENAEINVGRTLALLQHALRILDEANAPPEIGARVQEAIDLVQEHRELQL